MWRIVTPLRHEFQFRDVTKAVSVVSPSSPRLLLSPRPNLWVLWWAKWQWSCSSSMDMFFSPPQYCCTLRQTRLFSAGCSLKRWVLRYFEGERDDRSKRSVTRVDFTVGSLYWRDRGLHWRKWIYEDAAASELVTVPRNVLSRDGSNWRIRFLGREVPRRTKMTHCQLTGPLVNSPLVSGHSGIIYNTLGLCILYFESCPGPLGVIITS